jgi:AMP-polyphosphate phosphotransferase
MFESAELGHTVDKAQYEAEVPGLRTALLDAQYELVQSSAFPVVIVIAGVDGAGKGETVNLLNAWMDPRHIQTHAMDTPTDEEQSRPRMYRFWRRLPPKGKLGIFFRSWYTEPIVDRAMKRLKSEQLDERLEEIVRFERMLADEGALLLKFWFHLSKEQQRKRLQSLEKKARTRWRVTEADWKAFALYDRYRKTSARALRLTGTGEAPWRVVEGADARYRSLTVGKAVLASLRARLDHAAGAPAAPPPLVPPVDQMHILQTLDLSQAVDKERYEDELEELQGELNQLTRAARWGKKRSAVLVFEGPDAAGKGGAIRRITAALDARHYEVVPIAAPTDEERAQPYLWRFWRHLPRRGKIAIFDRSWYGRVLVERVEGFCSEAAYMRAYSEINDFEEQLTHHGVLVVKFYLQISEEEQLVRFKEREANEFKRFKITAEDWRNRAKWGAYGMAASDMVDRTSTEFAPWTLVEANDKNFARLKVLKTLCARIKDAIA